MEGPPEESGPAPRAAPGPLPDHRPPRPPAGGCLRGLALGCGGFTVLALVLLLILFLNYGRVVTSLEMRFVRNAVAESGVDRPVRERVEAILTQYDETWRKEELTIAQWKAAAHLFSQSPAALVLMLLEARAKLGSLAGLGAEEKERARVVLTRLARGAAEGGVTAGDLESLVRGSESAPPPPGEKARPVELAAIDSEELRRFLPLAEKLLEERKVPEGDFKPDLPALLRRDLWASLAEAKRPEKGR